MDLLNEFKNIYGHTNNILEYLSPGRVNLIGEHVDYNGGPVFPCAINFGTTGLFSKRDDNKLNFASLNFDTKVNIDTNSLDFKKEHDWANFLKGVCVKFLEQGKKIGGLDILIYGNIPGGGLSSSASIEVLMAYALNDIFDCGFSNIDLIKLTQKVENDYIGVNSGIMDQFAICMGKKDKAILLNCDTLDYEYMPLVLDGYKIIISNTNKKRTLSESKYNERRAECEKAVLYLNQKLNIKLLSEISVSNFEIYKYLIEDETALKRAAHVIYEIKRTNDATIALKNNDLKAFGDLMIQSHNSLRDLYEVSCIELDTLVEESLKINGVLGSRMTGAGFGGCTVSIVKDECIDNFIATVGKNYKSKICYDASFYIAYAANGTRKIV